MTPSGPRLPGAAPRRRGGRALAAAATALAVLALGACGGGSTEGDSDDTPAGGGTLKLGVIGSPPGQAAAATGWGATNLFTQAAYDSLLTENVDGSIGPHLATEWTYDATKTTLTLTLREGVTFTDGTPLDAAAVAANLNRLKTYPSEVASLVTGFKTVTAVDPTTVKIELTTPDPALLNKLAQNVGAVESPKHFDAPDEKTRPVGSGPYVLDPARTVIGSSYVYKKNPDYWAKDRQHYDELVLNVYATAQTQVNAVQARQVDVTGLINNDGLDRVKASGYTTTGVELNWGGFIIQDRAGTIVPALGDVRVRQAINHAVDRATLLKSGSTKGLGSVTTQIFAKSSPAYDPALDERYPFDPAKAKQLLAEAGYPRGFSLKTPMFPIGINATYDLVKQMLADVGIVVEYETIPLQEAIAAATAPRYGMVLFTLGALSVWEDYSLSVDPKAAFNPFRTTDPKVEALAQRIRAGSASDAAAASKELSAFLVEQAWYAPFTRPQATVAIAPSTEVTPIANGALLLQNITPKG